MKQAWQGSREVLLAQLVRIVEQFIYGGVVRKYRPDFLVRLTNGEMLILETKGQDTE